MKIDKSGMARVSDFGISMITSSTDYTPIIAKEYQSVHYQGKPIYQTKAFDELKDGKNVEYTSKFDVVFYGILLWKILARYPKRIDRYRYGYL